MPTLDPTTNRPLGDHGTAQDAIEYALSYSDPDMLGQEREFLKAWQDGDLGEWPEFYVWLANRKRSVITALKGATMWEAQVGRVWFALRFPRFWLFGRTPGYGRTWLYNWPGFIRIV